MGIKRLKDLIKKYAPMSISEVHLSNFRLQKIAIDVTLYLFRSKAKANSKGAPDQWITDFLYIVACLRRNNIHPIFVFDSSAPLEKDETKKERASKKQSVRDRVNHISSLLEEYYKDGTVAPGLFDFVDDKKQDLLSPGEKILDIDLVISKLDRLKSQIIDIHKSDFILIRELLDILGVPHIDAATEAEKTCSFLSREGVVDAVLTEDSDVLAYFTKTFVSNLDTVKNMVTVIDFPRVLQDFGLSRQSFLDLCIMCGTDYNNNIKGIGPEKSFRLISQYKSIENIEALTDSLGNKLYDTTPLNYIRTRELFESVIDEKKVEFRYTGSVDMVEVKQFLIDNNLQFNPKIVESAFVPEPINLVD